MPCNALPRADPDRPLVTLHELVFLHTVAVGEFGGAERVRDRAALESALARPLTGFGGTRLFETPFERAAALMEALLQHHGFVDGNKRVAVLAAGLLLEREGYELAASSAALVETTLALVEHRLSVELPARWLERNTRPLG